jgi:hypothetical protein
MFSFAKTMIKKLEGPDFRGHGVVCGVGPLVIGLFVI